MIRCLGGWCVSRDRCAHYYSESETFSERLCDQVEEIEPIFRRVWNLDSRKVSCDGQSYLRSNERYIEEAI